MKAVIQRVSSAAVTVQGEKRTIGRGLVILIGIAPADTEKDAEFLAKKIAAMRIFKDTKEKMNCSVCDIDGDVLVVSQFTLFADTKKGNRPSFNRAAPPDHAVPLYEKFIGLMTAEIKKPVVTGEFGADMLVSIHNDGPVTVIMDTEQG